jgi:predicted ATPase
MTRPSWRLARVHIENYRSMLQVTLELGDVTVLVGRNASGKSNVLDAVQFIGDSVRQGLTAAIESRAGRGRLTFGAGVSANRAAIPDALRLEVELTRDDLAAPSQPRRVAYGFALTPPGAGPYRVSEEWMAEDGVIVSQIREGRWVSGPVRTQQEVPTDRLVLPALSVAAPFEQLAAIRTLAPNPELMRAPQERGDDRAINRQGTNLYPCWERLERESPTIARRVEVLLRQLVPQAKRIEPKDLGSYVGIDVSIESSPGFSSPQDGAHLSDGTLRALALLVGLYQPSPRLLTAIEEPESFVHPYASELLLEALIGAPERGQLLLTTQSPTVLDTSAIRSDMLRVVDFRDGFTQLGSIAPEQEEHLRSHLVTRGELLTEGSLAMRPVGRGASLWCHPEFLAGAETRRQVLDRGPQGRGV